MNQGSVLDVLSGKESVKVSVNFDTKTLSLLVVGIFLAVLGGVIVARKLS